MSKNALFLRLFKSLNLNKEVFTPFLEQKNAQRTRHFDYCLFTKKTGQNLKGPIPRWKGYK